MKLEVLIPTGPVLETEVDKVVAEAANGSFCVKPRHVDFVAALVPGILDYTVGEKRRHLAVDSGILVKQGPRVRVCAVDAVQGESLDELAATVRDRFEALDEQERRARAALARLEATFLRGLRDQAGRSGTT